MQHLTKPYRKLHIAKPHTKVKKNLVDNII